MAGKIAQRYPLELQVDADGIIWAEAADDAYRTLLEFVEQSRSAVDPGRVAALVKAAREVWSVEMGDDYTEEREDAALDDLDEALKPFES